MKRAMLSHGSRVISGFVRLRFIQFCVTSARWRNNSGSAEFAWGRVPTGKQGDKEEMIKPKTL